MDKVAWHEESKDLTDKLEQVEGQVQQLQGEVEIHDCELSELHAEVCQAQEAHNKDDFMSKLLESKKDSTVSQLTEARESYEFEVTRLNLKLHAQEKELE